MWDYPYIIVHLHELYIKEKTKTFNRGDIVCITCDYGTTSMVTMPSL